MQTTRTKVLLILAIVFAGMAAWLANAWVQQQVSGAERDAADNTTPIVVAAVDITYGQELSAPHLKTVAWPNSSLPKGWVGDIAELEGRIAKSDIAAGDVVTKGRVVEHLGGSKLAALIQENMRAMSVRVDDIVGVAGFILPGNRVDIYGVRKNYNTNRVTVSHILQDVLVLAVDQDATPDEDAPKVVRAVTVEVTPKQTEALIKAMHEGKIQLVLRNPLEKVVEAPPPKPKPKPRPKPKIAKPAPKPERVTVIRGLDVEQVKPQVEKTPGDD